MIKWSFIQDHYTETTGKILKGSERKHSMKTVLTFYSITCNGTLKLPLMASLPLYTSKKFLALHPSISAHPKHRWCLCS